MKVRKLKSRKVYPKDVPVSTNNLHPRRFQSSLNGHYILSLLYNVWSSINKFLDATDPPKLHSAFERAYQDWILPQIQIKCITFISLSVLCLFAGLTVFSEEDYLFFDGTTKWIFEMSLAIMPYTFSSAAFILVATYYFPQLMERKQQYVITLLCLTAMVFIPAGNILLNLGEHGAGRMDTLLLNAHILLLTLLYYNQGIFKIILISIIIYIFINIVNIFTAYYQYYPAPYPVRQVS